MYIYMCVDAHVRTYMCVGAHAHTHAHKCCGSLRDHVCFRFVTDLIANDLPGSATKFRTDYPRRATEKYFDVYAGPITTRYALCLCCL